MLLAFALWRFTPPHAVDASREQYAVYSAFLQSDLATSTDGRRMHGENIVICSDPTSFYQKPVWHFFPQAFRGLGKNIGAGYALFVLKTLGVGRENVRLERKFALDHSYELARSAGLGDFFALGPLPRRSTAARRYFIFSEIAFNQDLTNALFYAENHCGTLCGEYRYIFMKKIEGTWTVAGSALMGVS